MNVYLVPVGSDRYELYCELREPSNVVDEREAKGWFRRLYAEFRETLRAAETGRRRSDPATNPSSGRGGAWRVARALRDRVIRSIAEAIAEQRLLWHLRGVRDATLIHPDDLDDTDALAIARRHLQRDAERHLVWLVVDLVALIVSGVIAIVPGPNILAYYFLFRVVGHHLSRRGARHALNRVTWRLEASLPLAELRRAMTLEPAMRRRQVRDVASRLELEHLAAFFERSATRSA